jgi:hypothetical protein
MLSFILQDFGCRGQHLWWWSLLLKLPHPSLSQNTKGRATYCLSPQENWFWSNRFFSFFCFITISDILKQTKNNEHWERYSWWLESYVYSQVIKILSTALDSCITWRRRNDVRWWCHQYLSSLSKRKMAGFSNSKWPMGEKKYSVHNSVELACVYVRCWLPARPCSSSIPILIAHENTRTHTHTPGGKWPPQAKKKQKKKM